MFAYLDILRPLNCLMSVIAVIIGGFLILHTINIFVVLGLIAVFLITGAGNVINDYKDVDADKINRPKRPIPSGKISKKGALTYCIILFVIGIALTLMINWLAFLIAVVNSFILIVYSTTLQHKMFAGNGAVAYLSASTFLFGGVTALDTSMNLSILSLPILLMLLSGLATFSREIVKDIEDIEGDRFSFLKKIKSEVKTKLFERFGVGDKGASLKYTEKVGTYIAIVSLILAIVISPFPYLLGILNLAYLIVLIPTDFLLAVSIYLLASRMGKKKYKLSQKFIKIGMFLGLIAFIVGVVF